MTLGLAPSVRLSAVGRTIDGDARGLLDHQAFCATFLQLVWQSDRFALQRIVERRSEGGLWVHSVSASQDRGDVGAALA